MQISICESILGLWDVWEIWHDVTCGHSLSSILKTHSKPVLRLLWYNGFSRQFCCRYPIHAMVCVLAALLMTQLSANESEKDGSSVWASATHMGNIPKWSCWLVASPWPSPGHCSFRGGTNEWIKDFSVFPPLPQYLYLSLSKFLKAKQNKTPSLNHGAWKVLS